MPATKSTRQKQGISLRMNNTLLGSKAKKSGGATPRNYYGNGIRSRAKCSWRKEKAATKRGGSTDGIELVLRDSYECAGLYQCRPSSVRQSLRRQFAGLLN